MALTAIKKYLDRFHVAPNLIDNDSTCATFSWEAAERELERSPEYRGLNIAYHCVDRHANSPRRDHLALRWLSKSGEALEVTYDDCAASRTALLTCCVNSVLAKGRGFSH